MRAARRAIESLYRNKATISGVVTTKRNGATETADKLIVENQPCRLSLRIQRVPIQGIYAESEYDAKLFISPELEIPENADIVVTDVNGRETRYVGGKPFGYANHQEIYMRYKEKVK